MKLEGRTLFVTAGASGNEYRSDALPSPACSPSAVAVGAVYDSAFGLGAGSPRAGFAAGLRPP